MRGIDKILAAFALVAVTVAAFGDSPITVPPQALLGIPNTFSTTATHSNGVQYQNSIITTDTVGAGSPTGAVVSLYAPTRVSGQSVGGTGHVVGVKGTAEFTGSNTLGQAFGLEGAVDNNFGGTITNAAGVIGYLEGNANASSTITNFWAFYAYAPLNTNVGTITNSVDFYSPDSGAPGGVVTNEYTLLNVDSRKTLKTAGPTILQGTVTTTAGSVGAPTINFGFASTGFFSLGGGIDVAIGGVSAEFFSSGGFVIPSGSFFGYSSTSASDSGSYDLKLCRDASGTLGVGTTACNDLGTINFSSAVMTGTLNKVTVTQPATAATLTIANNKTLTVNNTLTFAGTDSTTMTFPSTSATIARTDAANTFTGHQTIEGVTSTGATGTGNFVFSASPTFTGTNTIAAETASGLITGNLGLTITGAAVSLDASSNFNTSINTGTSTGTISIGNSGNTGKTSLLGLSTGTNADTLCLSAAGVVLLQAAACTISSKRFKNQLGPLNDDALAALEKLPVAVFTYKQDGKNPNRDQNALSVRAGVYAEDVAKLMPKCAIYENDMKTPKSYDDKCMIGYLIKANQQLAARVGKLEAHH